MIRQLLRKTNLGITISFQYLTFLLYQKGINIMQNNRDAEVIMDEKLVSAVADHCDHNHLKNRNIVIDVTPLKEIFLC
jgi:hypothetical protein